jgi:hypothetical protein
MAVNPVTKLVQPHGVVLFPRADSDALGYDRWRDELAVPDPFEVEWEPCHEHGPVKPPDVADSFSATEASSPPTAGPNPAAAAEPPSARRPAGTPAQS